jgi:membrane protein implicated in regulation of membrane protease activity
MPWWAWIVLGALLLGGEMLVPLDFWLLFIGLAALATGIVTAAVPGLSDPAQWAWFGVFAAASVLGFRRALRGYWSPTIAPTRADDTLVGEIGRVLEALAPGAVGKVELRGSPWSARCVDEEALEVGVRVRVERVDGLQLLVRRDA